MLECYGEYCRQQVPPAFSEPELADAPCQPSILDIPHPHLHSHYCLRRASWHIFVWKGKLKPYIIYWPLTSNMAWKNPFCCPALRTNNAIWYYYFDAMLKTNHISFDSLENGCENWCLCISHQCVSYCFFFIFYFCFFFFGTYGRVGG